MYSVYYNWVTTFFLPKTNKKKMTIEFIKNIEPNINKFPVPTQAFMRNKSISMLNGLARSSFILNDIDEQIIENKKIITNLSTIQIFFITRADKGNITVALDKDYYFNKIRLMLQNTNTYTIINKDPIKGISSRLKDAYQIEID